MAIRINFSEENLSIITKIIMQDNVSQANFYELEKLGFMVFQGSLGKQKRDALYVHKNNKTNEIKIQLESGFGSGNYARYILFKN